MSAVLIVAIVVGLPILGGLGLAAYKEWLKYRARYASAAEIEQLKTQIARLQAENQSLHRRLQNLETIVVSEIWEKRQSANGPSSPDIEIPSELES